MRGRSEVEVNVVQHPGRLIAFALLLGAGLLAACGGNKSANETATAATGTPPAATASATASGTAAAGSPARPATSTATATVSASAVATGSPTAAAGSATATPTASSSPADASQVFRELAKDRTGETISIRYAITVVEKGERRTGAWKIVQAPPKSLVYFTFDGSNGGEFWVINDGVSAIVCFDTADEAGQCIKTGDASTADSLVPSVVDVDASLDAAESADVIREVDGRTIAGRRARCFVYDADGVKDGGSMCLDASDGTMLYLSGTDLEMTATEVTGTVPASAFEAPFPVFDLGG